MLDTFEGDILKVWRKKSLLYYGRHWIEAKSTVAEQLFRIVKPVIGSIWVSLLNNFNTG
jgi:hypothetical protein